MVNSKLFALFWAIHSIVASVFAGPISQKVFTVDERYEVGGVDNGNSVTIELNSTSLLDGNPLSGWSIDTSPSFGDLDVSDLFTGETVIYTPDPFSENDDFFIWNALEDNGSDLVPIKYKVVINVNEVNNLPQFSNTVVDSYDFAENQNIVATIAVIDYDSDAAVTPSQLTLTPTGTHGYLFEASSATKSGERYTFTLSWKNGIIPDFESAPLSTKFYTIGLDVTDDNPSTVSYYQDITLNLTNIQEPPEIANPISLTAVNNSAIILNEDENTEEKEDLAPIEISASDPDGGNIY